MKARRHSRGFTLVEMLVAAAVMALGLTGAVLSTLYASATSSDSVRRLDAVMLARQLAEEVSSIPVARITDNAAVSRQGEVRLDQHAYTFEVQVTDGAAGVKNARVVVRWNNPLGQSRSVSHETVLSR